MKQIRAIIADDEEALRSHLKRRLTALWPGATIVGEARDGDEALQLITEAKPDIAFLDIRMPGLSGIEVARRAAGGPCLFVFVTAYDRYAVEAFDQGALDYLLKPVVDDRLKKTIERLDARLSTGSPQPDLAGVLEKVSRALKEAPAHLQWIKAQHKDGVRLIPSADILYFRATDKYTTVRAKDGEFLIRKSIKELEDELDPEQFWRVHRAAIVNVKAIRTVSRSVAGTLSIAFRDVPERLAVSRAYAHLFRQM